MQFKLRVLAAHFTVCSLLPDSPIPDWGIKAQFYALIRTSTELTVICDSDLVPDGVKAERGWRGLVVDDTLAFDLVGVISSLATTLAEAGISVFVISTYKTDYILIKDVQLEPAISRLERAGCTITRELP